MDSRAQEILTQIQQLTGSYGSTVTVNRIVQAATPVKNIFGTSTNKTTSAFTVNIIIESLKKKLVPTMAGMKNREFLKMIVQPGTFIMNDEIVYQGHTYRVESTQPVPFIQTDVVEFATAAREVD